MYDYNHLIYLDEESCVGCNKCIDNCPVIGANIAYYKDDKNKVKINGELCIHCGECIEVCDHSARKFQDDTEEFFEAVKKGKKISLIVAPSIRINMPDYRKLFGYFKSLGIKLIYDVSFGADITTWAYLKAIKEKNLTSVIAQPCPAIVNYIERYQTDLISSLAPIHSPMLCTAVYMKKHKNITDEIASISPCIGKADEIHDKNTKGFLKYNVTFARLLEYLKENKVNLNQYKETEFDSPMYELGFLFSRPGGLRENVEEHVPEAWVRQVEGQHVAYPYLKEYKNRIKKGKKVATLIDILNCEKGCNYGTGCVKENVMDIDDADLMFNTMKHNQISKMQQLLHKKEKKKLFHIFDTSLKLEDFIRSYDKTKAMHELSEPSEADYNSIFMSMNKDTPEQRNINCSACGYGACRRMAKAIFNNLNIPQNCIDYNRKEVLNEKKLLEAEEEQMMVLEELNVLSEQKAKDAENLKKRVADIINSVQELTKGNEECAADIYRVADDIGEVFKTANLLRDNVQEMKDKLEKFAGASEKIVNIAGQTNLLALNASIEAARAGLLGKSFSVVAEEVKKLSLESKRVAIATQSDQQMMQKLVAQIYEVSTILTTKMHDVNSFISDISAVTEQVAVSGQDISSTAIGLLEKEIEYANTR